MEVNVWTVFLAALFTAVMTGVGALPFLFVRKVGDRLLRVSNAVAGGLMLAASHSLVSEGAAYSAERVLVGMVLGLLAIMVSEKLIHRKSDVEVANLKGVNAMKALLILGVMTAHSFGEGIGVGVSFGGTDEALGIFVTTAIAFHNVPEGLAISLVLVPRGTSVWKAFLWSVFTSLPQPLMAVPAYLFVQVFAPFLPVGLGIAAGAMIWMVFTELMPEALGAEEDHSVGFAVTAAFILMLAFQFLVLK